MSKCKCLVFSVLASFIFADACYATSSTDLIPDKNTVLKPQVYKASVDMNDCEPLKTGTYVIIMGNGGTNMKASCPSMRPVMLSWEQQLGFGGIGAVSWGGGGGGISCCAVRHDWVDAVENAA